jgi:hypothetical protein
MTWQQLPFPSIPEDTAVFLAVDPRNHDVVYAAVRDNGVFKTTDGGVQWLLVNQGLGEENLSINAMTVNPHNPDEVFLGVADNIPSDGESSLVFVSRNAGETWEPFSEGLPASGHVTTVSIDPRTFRMLAGVNSAEDSSRASGVYQMNPPTSVPTVSTPMGPARLLQNSPNPFNNETSIQISLDSRAEVKLSLYSLTGERIRVLLHRELEAGEHQVVFEAEELSTGVYFYTLESGRLRISRRMVLIR